MIGLGGRGPLAINRYLVDAMAYHPVKNVAPIAVLGSGAIVPWVRAESPAKSLPDFGAQARASPGTLNDAAGGICTPHHPGGEALKSTAQSDSGQIACKGTQQALTSRLQGGVQSLAASSFQDFRTVTGSVPASVPVTVTVFDAHGAPLQ